jgi:hypothetical protein
VQDQLIRKALAKLTLVCGEYDRLVEQDEAACQLVPRKQQR